MAFKSIRARLTVLFSVCLAVVMVAAVFGLIWYSRLSAERNADTLLASTAQRTVSESEEPVTPAELISEEREDLRGTDLAISIVDKSGHITARTQKDAPGLSAAAGNEWRIFSSKIKNGDTVVVGMPWAKTREALHYHAVTLISLGAFVVMMASAGAWFLVGRALRPIPQLARQARASSVDNLAISLEPPSQDREMMELVDTLNGLLRRVTETTAAKGRFYSAASHELRTLLQALSGHLELALSRDRNKEEYKAAVEEAYTQTRRLISLVRALLFLYQLESSTVVPLREPVDLVEICRRSMSHFQPTIEERGLLVTVDVPDEVVIPTPPGHMDMLVRNLVENASKYATEGGNIHLNITADANAIRMEISNDAAVPPNWKPDDFFEPFSRPDSSRNTRTGGTGLGLAICKSIANANGWDLSLVSDMQSVCVGLSIRHE